MLDTLNTDDELIGVFGDIHGNLPALNAVLDELDQIGVDKLVCVGDIVGVYGWSEECCRIVQERCDNVVIGNHDRRLFPDSDFSPSKPKNIAEMELVPDRINNETINWLQSISESIRMVSSGVKITHSHPDPDVRWNGNDLIQPDEYITLGRYCNGDALLLGHTHIQSATDLGSNGLVLNPGAVGTPWDSKAEFAILNTRNQQYELRQVEYDTDKVERRLNEFDIISVAP